MYKFVILVLVASAAKATMAEAEADIVEELVRGGRWLVIATDSFLSHEISKCDTWVNVTRTSETTDCGNFKNVPVLQFTTDDGRFTKVPAIASTDVYVLAASTCTGTNARLTIRREVEDIITVAFYSDDVLSGHISQVAFAKEAPSLTEADSLHGIPPGLPLCYKTEGKEL